MNKIEFRYMVESIEMYAGKVGKIYECKVVGDVVSVDVEVCGARQSIIFSLQYLKSIIR